MLSRLGELTRQLAGSDPSGDEVGEEERLEGSKVAGLEEEPFELGVEVSEEDGVFRGKDGEVVSGEGGLESWEKEGFLNEFG